MNSLRHFFLVAVLFLAQLAVGAHAVEHAAGNEDALPTHTCELCLAAHNFGAALPSLAALPPVALISLIPESLQSNDRSALPPPAAPQRGPPNF
ncbi:MAG: hypothetical protein CVU16_05895 [Betaproteobacteria bacterium HGW-Betaproteobacteria-10]|nr:MAG: hypothetical protein CVU16_05895 [Betaproteobacteria bacterium HGW-Betaproteobacteria-10]